MRTTRTRTKLAAASIVGAMALTACGGTSGGQSGSGDDGETVAVDVGLDDPVNLSTGKLSLALIMNDTANEWEQNVVDGAQEAADSYGWDLDVLNPAFDVTKQLNMVQTAATSKKYDAILAIPVDGKLLCKPFSETLPKANVLVAIGAVQLCDRGANEGDELWQPGTLNWVGGTGVTAQYIRSWLDVAAEKNPGPQTAVIILGPEVITVSNVTNDIIEEWQPEHPDLKIEDKVYTDFTTPDAYAQTLDYLQAHPDTTLILSTYSPDMTRGVIQAVKALGMEDQVTIADSGGAEYTFEQIKAGLIQYTSPLFPRETGQYMVDSIKQAQDGEEPIRFVTDIPADLGDLDNLPIFTVDNLDTFTPEY